MNVQDLDLSNLTKIIKLVDKDEKWFLVKINKKLPKNLYDYLLDFCDEECRNSSKGYVVKRSETETFYNELKLSLDKFDPNKETSDSDSDDSDSDDELIQKVLAKRLTCESKGDVIEDMHISDSEMEDVVSLSRRIRKIYKSLKNIN
jgi:hypothetical protein